MSDGVLTRALADLKRAGIPLAATLDPAMRDDCLRAPGIGLKAFDRLQEAAVKAAEPSGWRVAEFREVSAYLSPDCPDLLGEVFPDSDTRIEISVDAGVPSRYWLRVATKIASVAAAAQGIAWEDADVFVALPEPGRCFTKSPGRITLVAYG